MKKCVCVGCKSGYDSETEKCQVFNVPKDEKVIKLWQIAIWRDDIKLNSSHGVCEKHFLPEDIAHERLIYASDGVTVLGRSKYKRPQIRKGALPTLNLGRPDKPVKSRKRQTSERCDDRLLDSPLQNKRVRQSENLENAEQEEFEKNEIGETINSSSDVHNENVETETPKSGVPLSDFFNTLFENKESFSLPVSWGRTNFTWGNNDSRAITIHKLIGRKNKTGKVESFSQFEITIDECMIPVIKVNGFDIEINDLGIHEEPLNSVKNLEELINTMNQRTVCQGCPGLETSGMEHLLTSFSLIDKTNVLRHKKCHLLLPLENNGALSCKCCKSVKNLLNKKIIRRQHSKKSNCLKINDLSPQKKEKITLLKKKKNYEHRAKQRAQVNLRLLRQTIKKSEADMLNIEESSLKSLIENKNNINKNERLAIMEILKATKLKNSKNRSYSDEWLILCIILHMRSPVTYRMIRDLKLLPLPCDRTIRRYLAQMDCPCGFDPKFFEILKDYFEDKSGKELQGVLLLDEMSTRKNLLLDQKTMTFKGVVDFGDNIPKNIETEMADHALVLIFQPLYEDYSQPIATFVSHGSTHGDKLAMIVVQAIILLENSGAKLHGIVSDGGTPNTNMWTRMGCSGKKNCLNNSFQHPLDEDRKIFLFWDTPHLIKCIRNRLANLRKLKVHPDEHEIKWEYFEIMHDLEKLKPLSLRLCPKITDVHINIAKVKMMKMRVSLAVQIFSKSVAEGLRYYRKYEQRLEHSESTAKFCCIINDMFDALNRTWKNSSTGFTLGCKDQQILEDSLKWLNAWEERVEAKLLCPQDFLTPQTSEGLRMTLTSMLDLAEYLLDNLKIDVFYTEKVNQDPLERFFGTVRLTCGTNDHPATPTFLQIYKILTFFRILKPPRSGNCFVPDDKVDSVSH